MSPFIGLLIAIGLAAGVWVSLVRQQPPTSPPPVEEPIPSVEEQQSPVVLNPLSIEAARTKTYDGRELTLGEVETDTASYTRYAITYKSGSLTISGILNIPKGDGPFPVIITNHGYIDPAVYTRGRGLKREQDYLARNGFAVLHPDYRCHAQSDCPEGTALANRLGYAEDVINAVKAVQTSDLPTLDKQRIGMLGHSMGGGIAWAVAVLLSDLKAFVQFAPVTADQVDSYNRWLVRRPEVAAEVREVYGEPSVNPQFWKEISAMTYFDQITAPFQIHHGTADESVPLEWSEKMVNRLRDLNKEVELFTYPGQPHEFTSAWGTVMQRTTSFFRENL